jgi:uncharacterized protein
MLAERLKLFATRTSKRAALIAVIAAGGVASGLGFTVQPTPRTPTAAVGGLSIGFVPSAEARDLKFKSAQEAYEQGLSAYRSGFYEIAIPALEYVVDKNDPTNKFFAEFYLARVFADNAGPHTDHAKAYMLFQRLADEHADIDPDDLKRAPFVAKALTAVAIYVRDGLTEIVLKPDPERAVEYLRHAATFFNEPDAQFELARIFITDDAQRQLGLHYLQKLSKEGHPGAQAVFADLMARGRHVKQDHTQALSLIKMAAENASPAERIWIEDIYQQIYCGSTKDVREKSKGLVATWRKLFAQPRQSVEQPMGLGRRGDATLARVCSNGERLDLPRDAGALQSGVTGVTAATAPAAATGLSGSAASTIAGPALGLIPSGVVGDTPASKTPAR